MNSCRYGTTYLRPFTTTYRGDAAAAEEEEEEVVVVGESKTLDASSCRAMPLRASGQKMWPLYPAFYIYVLFIRSIYNKHWAAKAVRAVSLTVR